MKFQCQSLSASGITAKAMRKHEAMCSMFNHTVACNIKHKCAYVLKMYGNMAMKRSVAFAHFT